MRLLDGKSLTPIALGALIVALATAPHSARAEDDASDLANQLSNPLASLISVPLQVNWDEGYGSTDDGERFKLTVQPVIPVGISENWNLISRTIVPILYQDDFVVGDDSEFGLGDTVQSLFFSPKETGKNGIVFGFGPAFGLPTATDDSLGGEQWTVGPTAVVLKQTNGWTRGFLMNHLVSVAGNDNRADTNATFFQPFLSYTSPKAVTYGLNAESTYDWESEAWSIPVNFTMTKLTKIGKQPVQIGGGLRYWAESPDGGPDGLGVRFLFTLLFPKH